MPARTMAQDLNRSGPGRDLMARRMRINRYPCESTTRVRPIRRMVAKSIPRAMLRLRSRTLTSFRLALTLAADVKRWTLTALRSGLDVSSMVKRWTLTSLRSGLDISNLVNPHFVRVRAICLNLRSMRIVRARLFVRAQASSPGAIFCERPVRARSFERAHPLAASLLFKNGAAAPAQQVLSSRRRHRALGRARLRARPNLAGAGGTRGSHFPALFDYFNLERKLLSPPTLHLIPRSSCKFLRNANL